MHKRQEFEKRPFPPIRKLRSPNSKSTRFEETGKSTTNTDLYQAVTPIYYLDKVCGLLPARFVMQSTGRYRGYLHPFDVFYSVCIVVAIVALQGSGFHRDLKDGLKNSTRVETPTALAVTSVDILGIIIVTVACILGSPFRWKHLQIIMDTLVEVDEKLGLTEPKKTRRYTILVTWTFVIYLTITSIIDIYAWHYETRKANKREDKGPLNYIPIYVMYEIIIITESQFAVCCYNIGHRFRRLNTTLENILQMGRLTDLFKKDLGLAGDFRDFSQFVISSKQEFEVTKVFRNSKTQDWRFNDTKISAEDISELSKLHEKLCHTIELVNIAYGPVMLTQISTCLLHLIITPYVVITQMGTRELIFSLVQVMWCIFHVWKLLVIVQPAHFAVNESKKIAVTVSRLLLSSPDTDVRKFLEMFSLEILHQTLDFTACGLFSLNRGLVTSMAGAITTYLVILIQFQRADDSKGDVDRILKNATEILKNATSIHNLTITKLSGVPDFI